MPDSAYLELLDWRRRVSELFAALRQREPTADTLQWFRAQKDALFRDHPQSPIPPGDRPSFPGLPYWSFDPQARVTAHFTEQEEESPPATAEVAFRRIGRLDFSYQGQQLSLGAFWIEGGSVARAWRR